MSDEAITQGAVAQAELDKLAEHMRFNSERWFPEIHDGHLDLTEFYTMGLAGEAGEVANEVKKGMRSGTVDAAKLRTELADVFTYLLLLADECNVNLVSAYLDKVTVNEARWGK